MRRGGRNLKKIALSAPQIPVYLYNFPHSRGKHPSLPPTPPAPKTVMLQALAFPADKPAAYVRLDREPEFSAARHLALEKPAVVESLQDLGYPPEAAAQRPSAVAVTSAFRVFSDEGLACMQECARQMKSNRNQADGTGQNRLGSYVRGAGYRSQFVRDFCESPELLAFLSQIVGVRLGRHSMPSVACGVNYAPEDVTRAVDSWHVDSVSFDMVILLTDPKTFRGGQFQYFRGTKSEGEKILRAKGEEGGTAELPEDRVRTMDFPGAGFGFVQQGNMVFHRARRLAEKADRVTMIPSFVALDDSKPEGSNIRALSRWSDPGMAAELARHEAWLAREKLRKLIDEIPLAASREDAAELAENAAAGLNNLAAELRAAQKEKAQ